jgi:NTP pyrophosphatase (non-canonical NTP hydrolase)
MSSSYQTDALRTLSTRFHVGEEDGAVTPDLLHGAIGLATEAGEMLDAVKRALFYGAELDRTNLVEELGDLEWYMAVIRDALGVSQEDVQRINIEKLRARYPEKFSRDHALQRDLGRERAVLEKGSD